MGTVKTGDRVRITIEGTLEADRRHDSTHKIYAGGAVHYFWLEGVTTDDSEALKVEVLEPKYEAGDAVIDADGIVFLRTNDGKWLDFSGEVWAHDAPFVARPLRKLVPESE